MSPTLVTAYLHWQFASGPRWLLQLYVTLQRAAWRLFSVSFMLRTLLAPWRRDIVSYRGLSLDRVAMALAWNSISRGIGLIVRLIVIALWMVVEAGIALAGLGVLVLFVAWPLAVAAGIAAGLGLIVTALYAQ